MKLKLEDKLEIIRLYEEGYPRSRIMKKINIGKATVNRVVAQYRTYGIESFSKKGNNRKFSIEFKLSIIKRILNGESKNAIANELMISFSVIHSWVIKYKELGYNGLIEQKKGRVPKMKPTKKQVKITTNPETTDDKDKLIKEQQERIAQLEMENDLLKKLRALVQQRNKQQDEKK